MKILHNPRTLEHQVNEFVGCRLIDAYESPARVESILQALDVAQYSITNVQTDLISTLAAVEKIHAHSYLVHLAGIFDACYKEGLVDKDGTLLPECFPVARFPGKKKCRQPKDLSARIGYYAFDLSAGIGQATWTSAIASADLARRGAETLVKDPQTPVFAMCRPPGHHCAQDMMGGYCYLNNTAIAVRTLLDSLQGQQRRQQVTILDLDFHHGNGTQSIFYAEKNPCYISIHGEDEYPYFSGCPLEIGEGEGLGYNLNLPIPCERATWDEYKPRLDQAVDKIKDVGTKWLVVSLGFDTFNNDPVGKFQLEREDYGAMGRTVGGLGIPTLIVLEGGYVIEELGNNCVEFLRGVECGRSQNPIQIKLTNGYTHKANGVNGTNGYSHAIEDVDSDTVLVNRVYEDDDEEEER